MWWLKELLKPANIRGWLSVLKEEGRDADWREMVRTSWSLGVEKSVWEDRMKACGKCPVYDRQMKRCRPYTGSVAGCGCFMPYKAMARQARCWMEQVGVAQGWGTE